MPQRPIKQAHISKAERFEAAIKYIVKPPECPRSARRFTMSALLVKVNFGTKKKRHHRGNQRSGQHVRGEHCENHSHG